MHRFSARWARIGARGKRFDGGYMDFLKLWNSESAMKVRQMVNRHECCKECTHETEGILPSIYFEPNSIFYKERIDYFGRETNR